MIAPISSYGPFYLKESVLESHRLLNMKSLKTQERIGTLLFVVAIILMLFSLSWKVSGGDKSIVEPIGFIVLTVAALYSLWFQREKKKQTDNRS